MANSFAMMSQYSEDFRQCKSEKRKTSLSRSGTLKDRAVVLDLKDYERALVWIDGHFSHSLPPGFYVDSALVLFANPR